MKTKIIAASLAAALVSPDCPVVAIVGDGGFGMMVQELETARRMSVAPLIVVFCDRSLAIIKTAQTARGLPFRGVDFLPVNWARVADGFGVRGRAVQSLDALRSAVRTWLGDRQPTVLAVEIDENLYAGLTY